VKLSTSVISGTMRPPSSVTSSVMGPGLADPRRTREF